MTKSGKGAFSHSLTGLPLLLKSQISVCLLMCSYKRETKGLPYRMKAGCQIFDEQTNGLLPPQKCITGL